MAVILEGKVKEGDCIKNYKELCKILDLPVLGGCSKTSQLKELKRFLDYEKDGQKFIITEIYDTPSKKDDKRIEGNNSIYIKFIEIILLNYLSGKEENKCKHTSKELWELLGMVNKHYKKIDYEYLKENDNRITTFELDNFYLRTNQKLKKILFSALNNLHNRCILNFYKETVIVSNNEEIVATKEQELEITKIKKIILNELGLESMFQIYIKHKTKKFYNLLNQKLNSMFGWQYIFERLEIHYSNNLVKNEIPKLEYNLKKQLNQNIINSLNNELKKETERQKAKYENNLSTFNFSEDHINIQQVLINLLIKID